MRYELKCIVFSIFWVYQLFHSQMDMRRREDHRFTQKNPQITFISDGVKTLVMIKKMYPLCSPSLMRKWSLVGLWIPHGNHRSIYALQPEGQAVFWVFFPVCWFKAALRGFTPSSLVSHFSGCHISSWNMTSAVRNVAVRLRPTSSCSFCPVCSRLESWSGCGGGGEMECFPLKLLQKRSENCPLCLYV